MYRFCGTWICCVLVSSSAVLGNEALPEPQTVEFLIREVPTDPESKVKAAIVLKLQPIERTGESVGWRVDLLEIRRTMSDGTKGVWTADLPVVPSFDGLWWVDHVTALAPETKEFAEVPWLMGSAAPLDTDLPTLDYDLEGSQYIPPPEGAPYEATGSLSYLLVVDHPYEPVSDANEDEPVQMPRTKSTDPM